MDGMSLKNRDDIMTMLMSELLLVLIVLYPALLILDDIEPGFVRSVVNPHIFLIVLIVTATLTPQDRRSRHVSKWLIAGIALLVGAWMHWRIGGGTMGATIALLSVLAVLTVGFSFDSSHDPVEN